MIIKKFGSLQIPSFEHYYQSNVNFCVPCNANKQVIQEGNIQTDELLDALNLQHIWTRSSSNQEQSNLQSNIQSNMQSYNINQN